MSKPPFMLPNQNGTELWPEATRIPVAVNIQYIISGDVARSDELKTRQVVAQLFQVNQGAIKQAYLKFAAATAIGGLPFSARTLQIAPGITGRFTRNGPHESLDIVVNMNAVLQAVKAAELQNKPPLEEVQPVEPPKYAVIRGVNTGSTPVGSEADSIAITPKFHDPILWPEMRKGLGYIMDPAVHAGYVNYLDNTLNSFPQSIHMPGSPPVVLMLIDDPDGSDIFVNLAPFQYRKIRFVSIDLWGFYFTTKPVPPLGSFLFAELGYGELQTASPYYPEKSTVLSTDATNPTEFDLEEADNFFDPEAPDFLRVINLRLMARVTADLKFNTIKIDTTVTGTAPYTYFGSREPVYGFD